MSPALESTQAPKASEGAREQAAKPNASRGNANHQSYEEGRASLAAISPAELKAAQSSRHTIATNGPNQRLTAEEVGEGAPEVIVVDGRRVEMQVVTTERESKYVVTLPNQAPFEVTHQTYEQLRKNYRNGGSSGWSIESTITTTMGSAQTESSGGSRTVVVNPDALGVTGSRNEGSKTVNRDGSGTSNQQQATGGVVLKNDGEVNANLGRTDVQESVDANGRVTHSTTVQDLALGVGPGGKVNGRGKYARDGRKGALVGGGEAQGSFGTDGASFAGAGKVGLGTTNTSATASLGPQASFKADFVYKPGSPATWAVSTVTTIGGKAGVNLTRKGNAGVNLSASAGVSASYKETEVHSEAQANELFGATHRVGEKPVTTGLKQLKAMVANVGSIVRAIDAVSAAVAAATSGNPAAQAPLEDSSDLDALAAGGSAEFTVKTSTELGAGAALKAGGTEVSGGVSSATEWMKGVKATKRAAKAGEAGVKTVPGEGYQHYSLTAEQAKASEMVEFEVQFMDSEVFKKSGGFKYGSAGMGAQTSDAQSSGVTYFFHLFQGDDSSKLAQRALARVKTPEELDVVGRQQDPGRSHMQYRVVSDQVTQGQGATANLAAATLAAGQTSTYDVQQKEGVYNEVLEVDAKGQQTEKANLGLLGAGIGSESTYTGLATGDADGVTVTLTDSQVDSSHWFQGWSSSTSQSVEEAKITPAQFRVMCQLARNPGIWGEACAYSLNAWDAWKTLGQTLASPDRATVESVLGKADGYPDKVPWAGFTPERQARLRKTATHVVQAKAVAKFISVVPDGRVAKAVISKLTDGMGYNLTTEYTRGGNRQDPAALGLREWSSGDTDAAIAKGEQIAKDAGLNNYDAQRYVYDPEVSNESTLAMPRLFGGHVDEALFSYRREIRAHSRVLEALGLKGADKDPKVAWDFCRKNLRKRVTEALSASLEDTSISSTNLNGWSALVDALMAYVDKSSYDNDQFRVLTEMGLELLQWRTTVSTAQAKIRTVAGPAKAMDYIAEESLNKRIDAYETIAKKYRDESDAFMDAVPEHPDWEDKKRWGDMYRVKDRHKKVILDLRELYLHRGWAPGWLNPTTVMNDKSAREATIHMEWDYDRARRIAYDRMRRFDEKPGADVFERW